MTLQPNYIPKGCFREIQKYQACSAENGKEACFSQKISIMEVCPDHILEGLREKRKWMLRAEAIDNETYKRAMTVSDYNKGRSVSDLDVKSWDYGHPKSLRGDSTWQDDRYDPTKYPHPHRYDNVNFPEQEYSDIFGGTLGQAAQQEADKHKIGLLSGQSTAMMEYQSEKRKSSLRGAVDEVNSLNDMKDLAAKLSSGQSK